MGATAPFVVGMARTESMAPSLSVRPFAKKLVTSQIVCNFARSLFARTARLQSMLSNEFLAPVIFGTLRASLSWMRFDDVLKILKDTRK